MIRTGPASAAADRPAAVPPAGQPGRAGPPGDAGGAAQHHQQAEQPAQVPAARRCRRTRCRRPGRSSGAGSAVPVARRAATPAAVPRRRGERPCVGGEVPAALGQPGAGAVGAAERCPRRRAPAPAGTAPAADRRRARAGAGGSAQQRRRPGRARPSRVGAGGGSRRRRPARPGRRRVACPGTPARRAAACRPGARLRRSARAGVADRRAAAAASGGGRVVVVPAPLLCQSRRSLHTGTGGRSRAARAACRRQIGPMAEVVGPARRPGTPHWFAVAPARVTRLAAHESRSRRGRLALRQRPAPHRPRLRLRRPLRRLQPVHADGRPRRAHGLAAPTSTAPRSRCRPTPRASPRASWPTGTTG